MRITTPHFDLAVFATGGPDAKKLALCLPGYCDTKDYPDMRTHAETLAARGYYAVAIDPPGTWESAGEIIDYTTTNYLRAINELIAHFGHPPTLLLGKSMGGRMAQLGAQNPAVIAFISVVGSATGAVADGITKEQWPTHRRHTPRRDLPEDSTRFRDFTIPYSFVEDAAKYNAFGVIAELAVSKLYIAGKDDDLVPPEKLRRAYDTAAAPKEFIVLPMDHDYRRDPAKLTLVNAAIAHFLETHNL